MSFTIVPASIDDSRDLWLWRNDSYSKLMSRSPDDISWSDHSNWFERVLASPEHILYLCYIDDGSKVGVCRFDLYRKKGVAEVSLNLNPQFRGQGFSQHFLSAAILEFNVLNKLNLTATIKKINSVSIKTFIKCGFLLEDENLEYYFYTKSAVITPAIFDPYTSDHS